jgi:hypothetical protein
VPEPSPSGRGKDSLWWMGVSNCFWWVDRTKGVAGMLAAQVSCFSFMSRSWRGTSVEMGGGGDYCGEDVLTFLGGTGFTEWRSKGDSDVVHVREDDLR